MAIVPTFPRQVRVLKCAIITPGLSQFRAGTSDDASALQYGLNLLPFVQKIDIYESIFDNTLSGSITLLENVGLTEYLPIVGVEQLVIAFQVDNQDPSTAQTFK